MRGLLWVVIMLFAMGMSVHAAPRSLVQSLHSIEALGYPTTYRDLVIVDPEQQRLYLLKNNRLSQTYPISTAVNGLGSQAGSEKTPIGLHHIARKIGAGAPINTVFASRMSTGKTYDRFPKGPNRDYITSRILFLSGLQKGINLSGNVDSYSRYIYIHGTHEENEIGKPASRGCIRMKNQDVIDLFEMVDVGTLVYIIPDDYSI